MIRYEINGVKLNLYKRGEFARLIGKSIETLTSMEKKGALPKTPIILDKRLLHSRLYCFQQLEGVILAFKKYSKKYLWNKYPELYYRFILNEWRAISIFSEMTDKDFF